MKVAFLMQDTRTLYGAEQATVRLIQGLAGAGVGVVAILLRETRLGAGESALAGALARLAPVVEIPVRGRFSRAAVARIRECMAAEKAEVLHSTGYKADWHAGLAAHWGRLFPVVSTVHGWLFRWNLKERLFQHLNLAALRRFSRVVVLCDFYERYLRRHGLGPLQIARIPTGLAADDVAAPADAAGLWADADAVFTFGMLGRLSSEKNHDLLLRAAARLARDMAGTPRSWRILVAGDGPLRERIQQRARRLGVADRVQLAGRLDPAEFFRQVHVLVQCSRVENQPMSVMEAMAWTRPTIATRAGGLPELVEDGSTGWVVPNRRVHGLAAAMKNCLVSPENARTAGLRARQRLENEYSYPQMVRDYVGLYATIGYTPRGQG